MRNHFVDKPVDLLKADGSLREIGWSTKQVWKYDKKAIKSNVFRIKEWDYYLVLAQDFGVAFTVSDFSSFRPSLSSIYLAATVSI